MNGADQISIRHTKEEQNPVRKRVQPSLRTEESSQDTLNRLAGPIRRPRGQGLCYSANPLITWLMSLDGDEIVLGPPKMGFTSNNRNITRSDEKRTPGAFSDDVSAKERGEFQDGFFKSRSNDPLREKPGRRTREVGEDGWTSVRNRRSSQAEEGSNRWDGGREERQERPERERRDPLDIPFKRNGVGRGFDRPWIRPENG